MMEKQEILVLNGQDALAMAKTLAREADLAALIGDTQKHVALKPNLVVPRPAADGATTHPEIAEGLVQYLQENGFYNLSIVEGSGVGGSTTHAFKVCGYAAIAEKYGVKLVDTQRCKAHKVDCENVQISICDIVDEIDFMINLPVMKGHCQTRMTCALKNNKGLIPDSEKRRFHTAGLHQHIAHLNAGIKTDFVVVDGICGDLDFEEGGNPVPTGRMFAARDAVLCDAFVAGQLGYRVEDIAYIDLAAKLGVGSCDVQAAHVRQLNTGDAAGAAVHSPGGKAGRARPHVQQNGACSVCHAALVRALCRLEDGELNRLGQPVCIGQGYRGKGGGVGVGACTRAFDKTVAGCPPSAGDIVDFLREEVL